MDYISVKSAATKWGISERQVQKLCKIGRIPEAEKLGKSWAIPSSVIKPIDLRHQSSFSVQKKNEEEVAELEAANARKERIINAFSKEYYSVFCVDFTNDKFETVKLNEEKLILNIGNLLKKSTSYRKTFRQFIDKYIDAQDRILFNKFLTEDGIKGMFNENDIHELFFRGVDRKEPFFIRIVKIDGEDDRIEFLIEFKHVEKNVVESIVRTLKDI